MLNNDHTHTGRIVWLAKQNVDVRILCPVVTELKNRIMIIIVYLLDIVFNVTRNGISKQIYYHIGVSLLMDKIFLTYNF